MNTLIPHTAWEVYLRLQALAASPSSGPIPSGRDEALSALLDDFVVGRLPAEPEGIVRRFGTLAANRVSKHRRRAQLDRTIAERTPAASRSRDHTLNVATEEIVAMVRDRVADVEWQTLRMLSEGYTCREVASNCGTSIETVKSRACRTRARVRASLAT
jgi:DNA-binding NarL/FixJ family response regulator